MPVFKSGVVVCVPGTSWCNLRHDLTPLCDTDEAVVVRNEWLAVRTWSPHQDTTEAGILHSKEKRIQSVTKECVYAPLNKRTRFSRTMNKSEESFISPHDKLSACHVPVHGAQGPSGSWWTPPAESAMAEADDEMMSSASFGYVVDTIAFGACVVGPYMAMTGLRRDG